LYLFHGAFNEQLALVENRDGAGNLTHKFHVVFNNNNGAVFRKTFEQFAGFLGFFVGHASGGFVNEKEFGVL
jgi:hypothetical protein